MKKLVAASYLLMLMAVAWAASASFPWGHSQHRHRPPEVREESVPAG
jgi:hypothetical protein